MFLNFLKKNNQNNDNDNVVSEYARLVLSGDAKTFLDVDTSLVVELRDEIEENIRLGMYSKTELDEIKEIDKQFKDKAKESHSNYISLIERHAYNAEYLEMVLKGLRYDTNRDQSKWWFHLID